ncbi:ankyrin repeat protein, partial [Baffinella frigidus]
ILLTAGADASIPDPRTGRIPLHLVIPHSQKATDMVIKHFPHDINTRDAVMGATPLFLAALNNKHEAAQALICRGADVNSQCFDGRGPLHAAADYQHLTLVVMLLRAGA